MKNKYKEIKKGERKGKRKEKASSLKTTEYCYTLPPSLRLQHKQYLFTKGFVTKTR